MRTKSMSWCVSHQSVLTTSISSKASRARLAGAWGDDPSGFFQRRQYRRRQHAIRSTLTRLREKTMRIVLIGVSHWHTPFYSDPVLQMTDAAIVGVSDPDVARAEPLAAKAKCPAFADYREMCATLKPDFAFVLGRHCDMAEEIGRAHV